MPSNSNYDAKNINSESGPSRVYEMSSSANPNLSAECSDDEDAPLPGPYTSRKALLKDMDSRAVADELSTRYTDEDREAEFTMREKEETRARERAAGESDFEDTMWWAWRATAVVALYALGSVIWFRILPHWESTEEGRS